MSGARAIEGSRPGTAVHLKGQRRVEDILDTAVRVLIDDGHGMFTMRRVADAADIRLSNLQYYFITKEALLNALLNRTIGDYREALSVLTRKNKGSPYARFGKIIKYLLKDQNKRESCLIFWELWALAGRDPEIGKIMDRYYDTYIEEMAIAIMQVSSATPKRKAQRHAALIVALIEGASLLRGFGKPRRTALAGFERAIDALCQQIASDGKSDIIG